MSSYAFRGEQLRDLALRHVGKPISELAPDLESDLTRIIHESLCCEHR